MKKLTMFVCLLALGIAVGMVAFRPVDAHATTAISTVNSPSPGANAEAAKTFTGQIAVMDGKYVLVSGSDTFQLDNQEKAKAFDGQNVKVTGTLDAATKTIRVVDIQAA